MIGTYLAFQLSDGMRELGEEPACFLAGVAKGRVGGEDEEDLGGHCVLVLCC